MSFYIQIGKTKLSTILFNRYRNRVGEQHCHHWHQDVHSSPDLTLNQHCHHWHQDVHSSPDLTLNQHCHHWHQDVHSSPDLTLNQHCHHWHQDVHSSPDLTLNQHCHHWHQDVHSSPDLTLNQHCHHWHQDVHSSPDLTLNHFVGPVVKASASTRGANPEHILSVLSDDRRREAPSLLGGPGACPPRKIFYKKQKEAKWCILGIELHCFKHEVSCAEIF